MQLGSVFHLTTWPDILYLMQHWFETEPAPVCNTPQHYESKIEGNKEVHSTGIECRYQIRFGGCSGHWASQEKSRSYCFFRGWADRQAEEWSSCHLIMFQLFLAGSPLCWPLPSHQMTLFRNHKLTQKSTYTTDGNPGLTKFSF